MSERFYYPTPIENLRGKLTGEEAHHAVHVMRYKNGDRIQLFDGLGNEFRAVITQVGKKEISFEIVEQLGHSPRPQPPITVAAALPKGDRQKFMIEKLVELGCDRLVPLITQRSVAVASSSALQRLQRGIVEACKQCCRNHLMDVSQASSVENLIRDWSGQNTRNLLACPASDTGINDLVLDFAQPVMIAIGPEGGFSEQEMNEFQDARWTSVRLAEHVLRTETAAIIAAGLLADLRRKMKPPDSSCN